MPWPEEFADTVLYGEREFIGDKDVTLRMVDGARLDIIGEVYTNGYPLYTGGVPYINVTEHGAVGDGITDDTLAIQNAIIAANINGGSEIRFGPGIFIVNGLTLYSNIHLVGSGHATIIKLANGANADVIVSNGFSGLTGGATMGGISKFKLSNLTIDANKANNTTGWCMRVYAYSYSIDNVRFTGGSSGGVWSQWGNGGTDMEAHWSNFKIYNCEGNLLDFNGPHDSLFTNGSVFNDGTMAGSTGTLVKIAGQAGGSQWTNIHAWGHSTYVWDIGASTFCTNCQAEGGTAVEVLVRVNYVQWTGGHIFGTASGTEIGVQFGIFGVGSAKGVRFENVLLSKFDTDSVPIRWDASAGNNFISGSIGFPTTATVLYSGTPNTTLGTEDRWDIRSADPLSLDQTWAIPKITQKRIWIPATEFAVASGTPVLNAFGFYLFDAAAIETVITSRILPAWWNTCDVVIHWANAGANAGDTLWAVRYNFIDAGQTVPTYTSLFSSASAAGAQYVVVEKIVDGDIVTTAANTPVIIRVDRQATGGGDTLADDAALIGLELVHLT